jgi:hypothetical protein
VREKHRPRVFENRVLRKIFGPKRDKVAREWRRLYKRSFMLCTPHKVSFVRPNQEECDGWGMWQVWGQERCIQGFGGET